MRVESIDDAARRLFDAQYPAKDYPGVDYDSLKPDAKLSWFRVAWSERLVTEPEAQPPGDGFQLSSEERGAVERVRAYYENRHPSFDRDDLRTLVAALSRKERES